MAAYEPRKLAPSFTYEIGPDVDPAVILCRFTCGLRSELDGAFDDLVFRLTGPTRELFNRTAIPIARFEIHLGINTGWIESKQPLPAAGTLQEPSPIQQGQL